jgi:hypothetical protein
MDKIGLCRLCQASDLPLRNSHVIPEFFYKRVYTNSKKFSAFSLNKIENLPFEQKGYRESLLCDGCETKFSKWETELCLLINELTSDVYNRHKAQRIGSVTAISGIDYSKVKMAVLSIFWRMGIATGPLFVAYDLGRYGHEIRGILDSCALPTELQFPIHISRAFLDGKFLPGILMPMQKGRYENGFIMQSVVLNGVVFDCFMTSGRAVPDEIFKFSLRQDGDAFVPDRSYDELGMNMDALSERMKRQDVKAFYKKHN